MPLPGISIYQPRGQCIALLFAALRSLGGSVTRREATDYIADHGWFAIGQEDRDPYPTQTEPRWRTLVAWARKDSAIRDWMITGERNSWALSRPGREIWDKAKTRFESGEFDVKEGYLWSPRFKKFLCMQYEPSDADTKRPWNFYRDLKLENLLKLLGLD